MFYFKTSAAGGFDDFKTDPFVTKDPFANEMAHADDPFHSHDPFTGSSNCFIRIASVTQRIHVPLSLQPVAETVLLFVQPMQLVAVMILYVTLLLSTLDSFIPLQRSGVRWLHFEVFDAIQV